MRSLKGSNKTRGLFVTFTDGNGEIILSAGYNVYGSYSDSFSRLQKIKRR